MPSFFARFTGQRKSPAPDVPQAQGTFEVGDSINGRYRLEAELGHGGMGIVYKAYDLSTDRNVAVKVMDVTRANTLTLQQFRREAEITAKLQHPHTVRFFETGTVHNQADQPFIVMELLQGTPLSEKGQLTYARIVEIGQQICEALEYIHEQGFLYRDLKPGNVILEKCGFRYCVKLIDFGLARRSEEAYVPNESTHAGSVFYLAPELIAGQTASISTDLYALGATLYELVTGRAPFSNINEQTILAQHLAENVSPPSASRSDVPPALEALILRLLEKDPKDRFASARDVREALKQIEQKREAPGHLPQINSDGLENQIEEVVRLLESNRLVTLLSEDDRLALAVGAKAANEFMDGVWSVKLESVSEPSLLLPAVAAALAVQEVADRSLTFSLLARLREKNLLLVLCQCGHVSAACGQLADTILYSCPDVHILATSATPLNIAIEKCYSG
jgi:serine/threonine protein kinase